MTVSRPSGLRLVLAAALIALLTLTGVGRGFAVIPATDGPLGATPPICHAGQGEASAPDDPAHPVQHECCDACALLAPAVLPAPPALSGPASVGHDAHLAAAPVRAPTIARPRDPRMPRGPPAA